MSLSDTEIFEKIREVLEDALGVDEDEVVGSARLGEDLGAESIDYLDISFRLEKAFEIKIGETEMFDQSVLSDEGFVSDGKVTDEGLAKLREKMPHADLDGFAENPEVEKLGDVFTVEMVCKFIKSKLG